MKEKGRYQFGLIFGISCIFVILPYSGYGAGLTIGNTILMTGIDGIEIAAGSPVYVNSSGQLGTVTSSKVIAVNCSTTPPESLQSAVDAAQPGDTINVTGTCNENLFISDEKARLILQGKSGAILHGQSEDHVLNIRGRGIVIKSFEITGGAIGIYVNRGATAVINGNNIHNAGKQGICIQHNSFAIITNNNIHDNLQAGIAVHENSQARIGFVSTDDTSPSPNTIQNNGGRGIEVNRASSARIIGNTIAGNTGDGIGVIRLSQADIADNTIDHNYNGIFVRDNSSIQVGEDNPTSFLDQPNTTTVDNNNTHYGIVCGFGGAVRGHLGDPNQISQINGVINQTNIDSSCPSSLVTP
jgi:parallel beta-helix repeat protein